MLISLNAVKKDPVGNHFFTVTHLLQGITHSEFIFDK